MEAVKPKEGDPAVRSAELTVTALSVSKCLNPLLRRWHAHFVFVNGSERLCISAGAHCLGTNLETCFCLLHLNSTPLTHTC